MKAIQKRRRRSIEAWLWALGYAALVALTLLLCGSEHWRLLGLSIWIAFVASNVGVLLRNRYVSKGS